MEAELGSSENNDNSTSALLARVGLGNRILHEHSHIRIKQQLNLVKIVEFYSDRLACHKFLHTLGYRCRSNRECFS